MNSIDRFNGLSTWEAAFAYEAAGLKIIPLAGISVYPDRSECSCFLAAKCPSPGKHAKIAWGPSSPFQTQSFDWYSVAECWHPQFGWSSTSNIGLPTGVNDLAVLDIDTRHGGLESLEKLMAETGLNLTDTFVQQTGAGGWHLIFKAPEKGIKSDSESFGSDYPGLDTRGRGGLIVVAPSRHVSGGQYSFTNVREPAPWPEALTERMVRSGGDLLDIEPVITIPAFIRGLADHRRETIYQMEEIEEGSRNQRLNMIAFRVATDGGQDEDFELLRKVAEGVGLDPVEVVNTIASGRQAALRSALDSD